MYQPDPSFWVSSCLWLLFTVEKPTILVVLHHTFNPNHVIAGSRRQVDKLNVRLTVDCLFYEGKLLKCNRNDIAWYEIQKALGVPAFQVMKRFTDLIPPQKSMWRADIITWSDKGWFSCFFFKWWSWCNFIIQMFITFSLFLSLRSPGIPS